MLSELNTTVMPTTTSSVELSLVALSFLTSSMSLKYSSATSTSPLSGRLIKKLIMESM